MSKSKPGSAKSTRSTKDSGADDLANNVPVPVIDERQLHYLTLEPVLVARHTSSNNTSGSTIPSVNPSTNNNDSHHSLTPPVPHPNGVQPRPILPVWSDEEINRLIQNRHHHHPSTPSTTTTGTGSSSNASNSHQHPTGVHEYTDPHAQYIPLHTAFGYNNPTSISSLVMVRPDPWSTAATVVKSVKDYIYMANGTKLTPAALLAQEQNKTDPNTTAVARPPSSKPPAVVKGKDGKPVATAVPEPVVPVVVVPVVVVPTEPDLPLALTISTATPTASVTPQLLRDIIVPNPETTLALSQLHDSSSNTNTKPVYDIPSLVQESMENFARILRVLGTTAASTSIANGNWLWDLIRPDHLTVVSPSSSPSTDTNGLSSTSSTSSPVSGSSDGQVYYVKLFWAGEWRCLTIKDTLPYTPNGYPLFIRSEDTSEVWVTLLWKAWYDINELSCVTTTTTPTATTNSVIHQQQLDAADPLLILHALTGWLPQQLSRTLTTHTPQDRNFTRSLLLTSLPSNIPTHGEKLREWSFASDDAALAWVRNLEQKELVRKRTIEADRRRRYEAGDFASMEEAKASARPTINVKDIPKNDGTNDNGSNNVSTLLNPLPKTIPTIVASLSSIPPENNSGSPEDIYPLAYHTTHRPVLPVPQEPYTVAQPVIVIATARSSSNNNTPSSKNNSSKIRPHAVPLPTINKASLYDSTYPQVTGNKDIANSSTHLIEGDSYILVMIRTRKVKTNYTYTENQPVATTTITPGPSSSSTATTSTPSAPNTRPSSAVSSVPSASPSGSPTKGTASNSGTIDPSHSTAAAVVTNVTPPLALPGYVASVGHTVVNETTDDEWNEPMVLVVGRKYRPVTPSSSSSVSVTNDHTLQYNVSLTDYLENITSSASITMDATIKLLIQNTPGLAEKIAKARIAHHKVPPSTTENNGSTATYQHRANRLERLLGLPAGSTKQGNVDASIYQYSELFQEPSILPPLPPPGPSAPHPIEHHEPMDTVHNGTEEEKKGDDEGMVRTSNALVSTDEEAAALARKEAEDAAQTAYEDAVAAAEAAYKEYLHSLQPPDPAEHAVALIEADRSLPSHPDWIDPTTRDSWIPLSQLTTYFPDPPIICYNPWITTDIYDPTNTGTVSSSNNTSSSSSSSLFTLHRHWRQAGAGELYDLPIDGSDVPKIIPPSKITGNDNVAPVLPSPSPVPPGGKGGAPAPAPTKGGGGKTPAVPEPVVPTEPIIPSPPVYTGPYVVPRTGESAEQVLFIPRLSAVAGGNGGVEAITSTTMLKQRIAVMLWQDTIDNSSLASSGVIDSSNGVSVLVERDPVITSLIARIPAGSIAPVQGSFLPRTPIPTPLIPTLPTRTRLQLALPSLFGSTNGSSSSKNASSHRFTVSVLEVGHDQGTSLDDADGDGILDGDVITPDMVDPRAPISCGTVYRIAIDPGSIGACVVFYPLPPARPTVLSNNLSSSVLSSDIHRCLEKAAVPFIPLTENTHSTTTTSSSSSTALTVNTNLTTVGSSSVSSPLSSSNSKNDLTVLFNHPLMTIGPLARVLTTSTGLVCRQITGVAPGLASPSLLQQQQQAFANLETSSNSPGTTHPPSSSSPSSSSSASVPSPCYWHVWTRQSITAEWLRTNRPLTKQEEIAAHAIAMEAAEKAAKEAAAAVQAQHEASLSSKSPSRPSSRGSAHATATTPTPLVPPVSTTPLPTSTTNSNIPTIITTVPTIEELNMVAPPSPSVNVRLWAKLDVASKAALPYVRIFSVNHSTNQVTAHPVLSTGIICIDLPLTAFHSSIPTLKGMDIDFPYLETNGNSNETLMIENTLVPIPSPSTLGKDTSSSPSFSSSSSSSVGISLVVAAYIPSSLLDSSSVTTLNPSTIGGPWCLTILANRLTPDNLLLRTGNLVTKALPLPSRYHTLRSGTCTVVPRLPGTLVKLDSVSPWGTMEVSELSKFMQPKTSTDNSTNGSSNGTGSYSSSSSPSPSPVPPTGKATTTHSSSSAVPSTKTTTTTPTTAPSSSSIVNPSTVSSTSNTNSNNAVPTFVVFSTEGVATHTLPGKHTNSRPSSKDNSTAIVSPLAMDPYTLALLPKPVPANPLVPVRIFRLCGALSNGTLPTMVGLRLELVPNIQAFIHLLTEKYTKTHPTTTVEDSSGGSTTTDDTTNKVNGSAFSRPLVNTNNKSVRFSSDDIKNNGSDSTNGTGNTGTENTNESSSDHSNGSNSTIVFDETIAHKIIAILRRVQTHLGIYNVNNGELLSTGSGRGSAEIVALPATVANIVPFHNPLPSAVPPPIAVSSSPTIDHGGRSPSPTSTNRPVSAKAGTTTAPGKSASTAHPTTATTTTTDTKPGVTFTPLEPVIPEWSQRADQYFQWTDTVRSHVRHTVAAQEASILNDAQFILQANILVPSHMVHLISYIPWRLAVCGPILKSSLTTPIEPTPTTAPVVPETGKSGATKDAKTTAPAPKGGKGGKEEPVPTPVPTPSPAAILSSIGLLPSPSTANDSPLKLWIDDRVPRLVQGIRNAITESNNITVLTVDTNVPSIHSTTTTTGIHTTTTVVTPKIHTVNVPLPESLRSATSLPSKGITLPILRDDIAAPLVTEAKKKRTEIELYNASKHVVEEPVPAPTKGGKPVATPKGNTATTPAVVPDETPVVETSPFVSLTRNHVNEILAKHVASSSSSSALSSDSKLSSEEINVRNQITAVAKLPSPYIPSNLFPSIISLHDIHTANTAVLNKTVSAKNLPPVLSGAVPNASVHPESSTFTTLRQSRRTIAKALASSRTGILSLKGKNTLSYAGNGLYHHVQSSNGTLTGANLISDNILGDEEIIDPNHYHHHQGNDDTKVPYVPHKQGSLTTVMMAQNAVSRVGQSTEIMSASLPHHNYMNTTLQVSNVYNQALHQSIRREQVSRITLLHESPSLVATVNKNSTVQNETKEVQQLRDTYTKYQTYQDIMQAVKIREQQQAEQQQYHQANTSTTTTNNGNGTGTNPTV